MYLPTYSPELNPIEQFWAVAKSKVKRHRFLQEDTVQEDYRSLQQCETKGLSRIFPSGFPPGFSDYFFKAPKKKKKKKEKFKKKILGFFVM